MLAATSSNMLLQGPAGGLLQCSVAALDLLRLQHAAGRSIHSSSSALSSSTTTTSASSKPPQTNNKQHGLLLSLLSGTTPRCLHSGSSSSSTNTAAWMHHSAVLDDSGDDDTTPNSSTMARQQQQHQAARSSSARPAGLDSHQQRQQAAHQQQHVGQLHNLAGQHTGLHQPTHQQQQHTRYQGHLHAPHGRRHATSRSQLDRFISEQLLSCKSLGMLRRIMIKHKATMEPEHVADTLLCLQHLVRASRDARRQGARGAGGASQPPFAQHSHQHAQQPPQARSQPRVRAAGEFSRSSRLRGSESDGHMEQLMAQMLGELGNMIWHQMGDMTGPDLAKVLYSWASLEWHPEPELLADVTASFMAAAAGGGLQQPSEESSSDSDGSASSASSASSRPMQPGAQQLAELEVWQGPWMAAGLWGLLKLGEPCQGTVLHLLRHWQQLAHYWTPQQLADVVAAITATADEQVAAIATAGSAEGQQAMQQQQEEAEQQMVSIVLGLSQQLLVALSQRQQGGSSSSSYELLVPLPWPESMLIQVQQNLLNSGSVPAAQRAAAAVSDIAASTASASSATAGGSEPSSAASAAGQGVPLMAVHNIPQLAWRMLQGLSAVGVNVSEPQDQEVGALVAELSAATKVVTMLERAM